MVEPFVTYIRTIHFLGPDLEKRYFRIFGDLEYDLLALKIETEVMKLRLREVRRRATTCVWISPEDERQINVTSHELNEHLYNRLERLRDRIAYVKQFRFDHDLEKQGYYLLYDIATAVLGIADAETRNRERDTLENACAAYARLDLSELLEIHDQVQEMVGLGRRDRLEAAEKVEWHEGLRKILSRHPLRHAEVMISPEGITGRMEMLKRKITIQQKTLENYGMVYTAAVRAIRYRN
ncbi:MAG: hypothetical protein ABI876_07940 [Bacteroidota bacterium]